MIRTASDQQMIFCMDHIGILKRKARDGFVKGNGNSKRAFIIDRLCTLNEQLYNNTLLELLRISLQDQFGCQWIKSRWNTKITFLVFNQIDDLSLYDKSIHFFEGVNLSFLI